MSKAWKFVCCPWARDTGSIECGAEISLAVRREYVFDCELERMNRGVLVTLDGVPVITRHTPLWNWVAP